MPAGLQVFDSNGAIVFDSTKEHVLFEIAEQYIEANGIAKGQTLSFSYPAYTGKKINAFMQSPINVGSIEGYSVLSCRVRYVNGVPIVDVFIDNNQDSYPNCDGYFVVLYTGANL